MGPAFYRPAAAGRPPRTAVAQGMTDDDLGRLLLDIEENLPHLLDTGLSRREHARADVLRRGRVLAERYGERLTLLTFCREAGCRRHRVYEAFDSFGDLREELGLSRRAPPFKRAPGRDELLAGGRELAASGGTFNGDEAAGALGVSLHHIGRLFGGWAAFADACGLKRRIGKKPAVTDAAVLSDVCATWLRFGTIERFLLRRVYARSGRLSAATVYNRLGGWPRCGDLASAALRAYAETTGRDPWLRRPAFDDGELIAAAERALNDLAG